MAIAGWYLFVLGTACGMTALLITAYEGVSPRWLRWLLFASAAFLASRYAAMAAFAIGSEQAWPLRRCWLGSAVGLTFPGAVALDQLVRDPRMTPTKLLKQFSPFLVAYALVVLVGRFELASDPITGSYPRLVGWARLVLITTQATFVAGFVWMGIMIIRRLPLPRIRRAIIGLVIAYSYLSLDGLLVGLGIWYFRPFLVSEMVMIATLWHAFQTAKHATV